MTQTLATDQNDVSTTTGRAAPDCRGIVQRSHAALALIDDLGHVMALSSRLALRLALDSNTALDGLPLRSLWAPGERGHIDIAFSRARQGTTSHLPLDLSYPLGGPNAAPMVAHVTLRRLPGTSNVILTLDLPISH